MIWLMLAAVGLAFAIRLARQRRRLFTVVPGESISTVHVELAKRHDAKTKAALAAATAALR